MSCKLFFFLLIFLLSQPQNSVALGFRTLFQTKSLNKKKSRLGQKTFVTQKMTPSEVLKNSFEAVDSFEKLKKYIDTQIESWTEDESHIYTQDEFREIESFLKEVERLSLSFQKSAKLSRKKKRKSSLMITKSKMMNQYCEDVKKHITTLFSHQKDREYFHANDKEFKKNYKDILDFSEQQRFSGSKNFQILKALQPCESVLLSLKEMEQHIENKINALPYHDRRLNLEKKYFLQSLDNETFLTFFPNSRQHESIVKKRIAIGIHLIEHLNAIFSIVFEINHIFDTAKKNIHDKKTFEKALQCIEEKKQTLLQKKKKWDEQFSRFVFHISGELNKAIALFIEGDPSSQKKELALFFETFLSKNVGIFHTFSQSANYEQWMHIIKTCLSSQTEKDSKVDPKSSEQNTSKNKTLRFSQNTDLHRKTMSPKKAQKEKMVAPFYENPLKKVVADYWQDNIDVTKHQKELIAARRFLEVFTQDIKRFFQDIQTEHHDFYCLNNFSDCVHSISELLQNYKDKLQVKERELFKIFSYENYEDFVLNNATEDAFVQELLKDAKEGHLHFLQNVFENMPLQKQEHFKKVFAQKTDLDSDDFEVFKEEMKTHFEKKSQNFLFQKIHSFNEKQKKFLELVQMNNLTKLKDKAIGLLKTQLRNSKIDIENQIQELHSTSSKKSQEDFDKDKKKIQKNLTLLENVTNNTLIKYDFFNLKIKQKQEDFFSDLKKNLQQCQYTVPCDQKDSFSKKTSSSVQDAILKTVRSELDNHIKQFEEISNCDKIFESIQKLKEKTKLMTDLDWTHLDKLEKNMRDSLKTVSTTHFRELADNIFEKIQTIVTAETEENYLSDKNLKKMFLHEFYSCTHTQKLKEKKYKRSQDKKKLTDALKFQEKKHKISLKDTKNTMSLEKFYRTENNFNSFLDDLESLRPLTEKSYKKVLKDLDILINISLECKKPRKEILQSIENIKKRISTLFYSDDEVSAINMKLERGRRSLIEEMASIKMIFNNSVAMYIFLQKNLEILLEKSIKKEHTVSLTILSDLQKIFTFHSHIFMNDIENTLYKFTKNSPFFSQKLLLHKRDKHYMESILTKKNPDLILSLKIFDTRIHRYFKYFSLYFPYSIFSLVLFVDSLIMESKIQINSINEIYLNINAVLNRLSLICQKNIDELSFNLELREHSQDLHTKNLSQYFWEICKTVVEANEKKFFITLLLKDKFDFPKVQKIIEHLTKFEQFITDVSIFIQNNIYQELNYFEDKFYEKYDSVKEKTMFLESHERLFEEINDLILKRSLIFYENYSEFLNKNFINLLQFKSELVFEESMENNLSFLKKEFQKIKEEESYIYNQFEWIDKIEEKSDLESISSFISSYNEYILKNISIILDCHKNSLIIPNETSLDKSLKTVLAEKTMAIKNKRERKFSMELFMDEELLSFEEFLHNTNVTIKDGCVIEENMKETFSFLFFIATNLLSLEEFFKASLKNQEERWKVKRELYSKKCPFNLQDIIQRYLFILQKQSFLKNTSSETKKIAEKWTEVIKNFIEIDFKNNPQKVILKKFHFFLDTHTQELFDKILIFLESIRDELEIAKEVSLKESLEKFAVNYFAKNEKNSNFFSNTAIDKFIITLENFLTECGIKFKESCSTIKNINKEFHDLFSSYIDIYSLNIILSHIEKNKTEDAFDTIKNTMKKYLLLFEKMENFIDSHKNSSVKKHFSDFCKKFQEKLEDRFVFHFFYMKESSKAA